MVEFVFVFMVCWQLMRALPIVVFSYTSHPNALPVYRELKRFGFSDFIKPKIFVLNEVHDRPDLQAYAVLHRSMLFVTAIYTALCIFVYLTFRDQTLVCVCFHCAIKELSTMFCFFVGVCSPIF